MGFTGILIISVPTEIKVVFYTFLCVFCLCAVALEVVARNSNKNKYDHTISFTGFFFLVLIIAAIFFFK